MRVSAVGLAIVYASALAGTPCAAAAAATAEFFADACNTTTILNKEWSGPSMAHGFVGDGTPAACARWCCAKGGCAAWSLLLDPSCHLRAGQRCCMGWQSGRTLIPSVGTQCVSGQVSGKPSPPPAPAPVATKLALAPAAPPASQFYHNLSLASWGANAIEHDGLWHSLIGVYYTETQSSPTTSCGLGTWKYDSTVAYATSKTALGPYEYVNMALPPCAQAKDGQPCGYNTNPELRRHPDGTWLLFTLGGPPLGNLTALCDAPCSGSKGNHPKIGRNASLTRACSLGDTECLMADGCPVEQIQLRYAKQPAGPWQTLTGANERRDEGEIVWCAGHQTPCNTSSSIACCGNNLAPLVLPNGKMVMMANSACKDGQKLPKAKYAAYRLGCFTPFVAESWDAPYLSQLTHANGLASIPTRTSWSSTPIDLPHDGCFAEDPVIFLHTDSASNVTRFKCIFHTFGEGANDGDGCNHGDWHPYTGGYAEAVNTGDSLDALLGEWSYNFSEPAYSGTVSLEDGKAITYHKRERPKVALDESGVPVAVVNAVTAQSGAKFSGWTYTFAQRILGFKADDEVAYKPRKPSPRS